MNCDVKKLRCASLRSALQRCGALSQTHVIIVAYSASHAAKMFEHGWPAFLSFPIDLRASTNSDV